MVRRLIRLRLRYLPDQDTNQGDRHPSRVDFDSLDIERGTALLQATEKATRIGRAFAVGKVLLVAYRVLRKNLLTYDGQDFFDAAHQHPDGTLASNLVTVPRTTPPRRTWSKPARS